MTWACPSSTSRAQDSSATILQLKNVYQKEKLRRCYFAFEYRKVMILALLFVDFPHRTPLCRQRLRTWTNPSDICVFLSVFHT